MNFRYWMLRKYCEYNYQSRIRTIFLLYSVHINSARSTAEALVGPNENTYIHTYLKQIPLNINEPQLKRIGTNLVWWKYMTQLYGQSARQRPIYNYTYVFNVHILFININKNTFLLRKFQRLNTARDIIQTSRKIYYWSETSCTQHTREIENKSGLNWTFAR